MLGCWGLAGERIIEPRTLDVGRLSDFSTIALTLLLELLRVLGFVLVKLEGGWFHRPDFVDETTWEVDDGNRSRLIEAYRGAGATACDLRTSFRPIVI